MSDESPAGPPTYFPEGSVPQLEELCRVCREEGIPQVVEALKKQALPCYSLEAVDGKGVGGHGVASKIGGVPDLPSSEVWPTHDGKSLSFIAQINLAEIPRSAASEALPASGVLFFFYDAEQSTWGHKPKDNENWRVLFSEEVPTRKAGADFPSDIPEYARYKELLVKAVEPERYTIPQAWGLWDERVVLGPGFPMRTPEFFLTITREGVKRTPTGEPDGGEDDSPLTNEQWKQADDIFFQYGLRLEAWHRLLGHPDLVQDCEMRVDCQLVSHGFSNGRGEAVEDPEAQALLPGLFDWRLLLQVNSDKRTGMMWGDSGRLYFWIREEDLAARCFENVWMILQCG